MMQNELNMQQQYNDSAQELQQTQVADRVSKDARWPNYYGDQDPQPNVTNDMDSQARALY